MSTLRQRYDIAVRDRTARTGTPQPHLQDWAGDSERAEQWKHPGLVTGLFRRLIDLALQDDLLALDAAGLAAAVEEVDVAELPQRIGDDNEMYKVPVAATLTHLVTPLQTVLRSHSCG